MGFGDKPCRILRDVEYHRISDFKSRNWGSRATRPFNSTLSSNPTLSPQTPASCPPIRMTMTTRRNLPRRTWADGWALRRRDFKVLKVSVVALPENYSISNRNSIRNKGIGISISVSNRDSISIFSICIRICTSICNYQNKLAIVLCSLGCGHRCRCCHGRRSSCCRSCCRNPYEP